MVRYGMVIDLKRCVGCQSCTIACKVKNHTKSGIFWNKVLDIEEGEYPSTRRVFYPRLCMHCDNAPCVEVCPTHATYKREDGIVLIDYDKCAGCKCCIVACPYGSRYFNDEKNGYFKEGLSPNEKTGYLSHRLGVVEKCTFCADLVIRGQQPVCVRTCIGKARYFGDLNDPTSEVSQLITSKHGHQLYEELSTGPSIYYLPP